MPPAAVFQPPTNIRNLKPTILPKPLTVGNANFFTSTNAAAVPSSSSSSQSHYDDTLCNGKSLIVKPTISMPTIIKPVSSSTKGKAASPTHIELKKTETIRKTPSGDSFDCDNGDDDDDSCSSPPMPSFAPPPLPSDVLELANDEHEREPYAIALYDFETEVAEDLNFRVSHWRVQFTHTVDSLFSLRFFAFCLQANEKIYLIKQMNDEWVYGRNKRGCEGIFPISYVEVQVPIKQVEPDSGTASRSESVSPAVEGHRIKVLYTFNSETADDLTIVVGSIV